VLIDLVLIAAGLALLVAAGDLLVRGAVSLSLRLGISALVVSLTIVAIGTSAPELVVSVVAVLKSAPDMALGNAIGSNTANILLVLGIPAIISTIKTRQHALLRNYAMMLAAAVLFVGLAWLGPIRWPHALALLTALSLVLLIQTLSAKRQRRKTFGLSEGGSDQDSMSGLRIGLFLALGLSGLPLGAHLLVAGASDIARAFGVSEAVIGLTLVAIGTSLPELSTSVSAAFKGRADVALGNVVGSNIFNLLGIIGVAGLIGTLPVPRQMLEFDLWVMLAATVALGVVLERGWPIGRTLGIGMVAAYIAYTAVLGLGMWG
jgi:cation:H+ antiporter